MRPLAPTPPGTLASYRKSYIPGASYIARYFITPTLSFTYRRDRLGRPPLRRHTRQLGHRDHPA